MSQNRSEGLTNYSLVQLLPSASKALCLIQGTPERGGEGTELSVSLKTNKQTNKALNSADVIADALCIFKEKGMLLYAIFSRETEVTFFSSEVLAMLKHKTHRYENKEELQDYLSLYLFKKEVFSFWLRVCLCMGLCT